MARISTLAWSALLWFVGQMPAQVGWRPIADMVGRTNHSMAYDPVRDRVVLFGGTLVRDLNDTWEWDGTSWQRMWPTRQPSPRWGHSMAFDPVSQRIILFGGGHVWFQTLLDDTWAWDGRDWTQLTPAASPSPRANAAMDHDPTRGTLVLFGGATYPLYLGLFPTPNDETWEWSGLTWVRRFPMTTPPARVAGELGYCGNSGRLVLVGSGTNPPSDTFEWDGTNWISSGVKEPSGVWEVASEPGNGGVIAYRTQSSNTPNDTFQWDGTGWTQLPPAATPLQRDYVSLATDTRRGQVILFGHSQTQQYNNTWAWSGTVWQKVNDYPRMFWLGTGDWVHDPVRDELVGIGSPCDLSCSAETWTLDNAGFHQKAPSQTPPGNVRWSSFVYHPGAQRGVLFGGFDPNGGCVSQTWLWDGSDWMKDNGPQPPCKGPCVYDSTRDKLVLLTDRLGPMWEWDPGSGWQQTVPPVAAPPLLISATYDPVRQRIVAYGGTAGPALYEYDGVTWVSLSPPNLPNASRIDYVPWLSGCVILGGIDTRTGMAHTDCWLWDGATLQKLPVSLPTRFTYRVASAYDAGRQRLVLGFDTGQVASSTSTSSSSFWELRPWCLSTTQRYPRPGESLALTLGLPAEAGSPYVFALSDSAYPGIPVRPQLGFSPQLLPLAAGPLLDLSLSAGLSGRLDAQGNGGIVLQIPPLPWIAGLTLHAAAVTLGPGPTLGTISHDVRLDVIR